MLANMRNLLKEADSRGTAIGCFNATGLENILAVIAAAEKLHTPVMIQFAQAHEEEHLMTLDVIGPVMMDAARRASVPVGVHLEHAVELVYIRKALELGFTSVMFDGSDLPYDENILLTRRAVELARKYGASVEAEIGVMAGITLNNQKIAEDRSLEEKMYTDPKAARQFAESTGIDCLACTFGTVHGFYKSAPRLNFELVEELYRTLPVPIVMHGGSGISREDYRRVIRAGVRKINYYTYMAKAGGEAAEKAAAAAETPLFHDLASAAVEAVTKNAEEALQIFSAREE